MIRSFDWRDVPILHRYRNRELYLSSIYVATRGTYIIPGILRAFVSPSSGVFTAVLYNEDKSHAPILGQIMPLSGEKIAHISFLAPKDGIENHNTRQLLEHLCQKAGEFGNFYLIAEPEDQSPVFSVLRSAGFTTYARQRIWKYSQATQPEEQIIPWRLSVTQNYFDKTTLYNNIVPGIVKQIENLEDNPYHSLVHYTQDNLLGFVDLIYGYRGIWVHPIVHPDVENIESLLLGLIQSIPDRRNRPIHICVRTYQSWLEPALEQIGALATPLQAVMVKRLVVRNRVRNALPIQQLEGQPEVPLPLTQSKRSLETPLDNIVK